MVLVVIGWVRYALRQVVWDLIEGSALEGGWH